MSTLGYRFYDDLKYHSLCPTCALQTWIERTHLDVMRTVCYQPGPLVLPDLGEFSMEATEPISRLTSVTA